MAYTTIDDPSEYFHTQIYAGDGNDDRSITNDANAGNFSPDWLWIKNRSSTNGHALVDTTRGATKVIRSQADNAEETESNGIQAFETDGFQIGTSGLVNTSSNNYVAWQWKANGGTTTTNDASATSIGTIDSVYQANTTAGFSIVTYTGTGSAGTIAHGLGVTPSLYIIKNRDRSDTWRVASEVIGYGNQLLLGASGSDAVASDTNTFNNTAPTSTVFSVGTRNATNASGEGHVAYVFASIQGYSKIGNYEGNGNADGPFVYTGFKPALLITKEMDNTGNWFITDNKRDTDNDVSQILFPNLNNAETTGTSGQNRFDFVSNGFKIRGNGGAINTNGSTHIYIAFAEHPFVSSKGVPVTAR